MGKRFCDLKKHERVRIQSFLFEEYCAMGRRLGRIPTRTQREEILRGAYRRVQEAGIVISLEEVRQYFGSKESRFRKRLAKEISKEEEQL